MTSAFDVRDLASWTRGEIQPGADTGSFTGVGIDSRSVQKGDLFVAIRGEVHDAHRFIDEVLASGVAGLLVERGRAPADASVPVVVVEDTTRALGTLAAGHRSRFGGPVVAITGSSGKTTTKEMCAAILSQPAPCLRNMGNLNNQYGLPLSLLQRGDEHSSVVVELGMNHRGEISQLCAIAKPTVGVITNVGTAHIEFLGSQDEIAQEKGDLFAALPADAVAAVNLDDPRVVQQARRTLARQITFGLREAEMSAENVRSTEGGRYEFTLVGADRRTPIRVAGLGDTTVINALAAAAAATAAGASLDEVAAGLGRYQPLAGRMAPIALPRGMTLIDDSYNANPQSMRSALESLARLRGSSRALAILGDMGELGELADEAHRETGRIAAQLEIDFLLVVGSRADLVTSGAVAAGMDPTRIHRADEHEKLADLARELWQPGDWLLVKGSRAMKMERIVESLARGTR